MSQSSIKDSVTRFWTSVHEALFKASDGRLGGKIYGMPVVMLTTTGRKTGRPRSTMLTSPVQEDDKIVLVASYGGDDRHPKWFLNLRANPDVEVRYRRRTQSMRARVATPEEKDALWPRVVQAYKGYAGYQTKTDRDIPLVILEPTDA
jgi:deazaflavin-dependent oxidoreductase (nitroreductase family)